MEANYNIRKNVLPSTNNFSDQSQMQATGDVNSLEITHITFVKLEGGVTGDIKVTLTLICGTVILVSGFLSNILRRRFFKSSDMSALQSGTKMLSMSEHRDGEALSDSREILTSQEAPLVGS